MTDEVGEDGSVASNDGRVRLHHFLIDRDLVCIACESIVPWELQVERWVSTVGGYEVKAPWIDPFGVTELGNLSRDAEVEWPDL